MSDSDAVERARRAAEMHGSLDHRNDDRYAVRTTVFDATVTLGRRDGAAVFTVVVSVPTLDAVTEEHVASVVEDGWYETFALRLDDVDGVVSGADPDVTTERAADAITVEIELADPDARRGADDAVAAVEYVEGTYVQGVIPGYEYTDPVRDLIQRATDAAGGREGGTPL
ncbi:MAG: DUF5813 family protein [Haloquadratum sp.]